ncbi:E3 ubiquitin-protein ligase hrd1 [Ophidiomyces ophidiicola]|nr:E3 ubiquitin-protein ligase hrd1 [Ophidiomyces ophidiicola]
MMRLAAYTGASLTLAASVVLKALHQRANFYSACVYLSQSNANLMILTNICLLVVGYLLFGLQRLLYGRLRPIEIEQLYEKGWFAVTETCLAMTIFRGELGGWFVVMFVCLLVGRVWGWIGEGRVEVLEQHLPNNPPLFHTRLAISLLIAVSFNSFMLKYAIRTVLRQARPDMMVMFGFEFAVLTILSTSTTARYALSLTEMYIVRQQKHSRLAERRAEIEALRADVARERQAPGSESPGRLPSEEDIDEMELDVPGWEEKGRFVFYLDLVTDFLKLIVYLSFFAILFTFYGLPIHILRDVVLTMRSFAKRILDFIRYRNATRDMNQRYPDATAEEIAREDVCIICREEMRPWQPPPETPDNRSLNGRTPGRMPERLRPKKLPCGHLLHFACLRSWLERQQNCPTCRRPVTMAGQGRTGLNQGNPPAGENQQPIGNGQPAPVRPRAWMLNLGPLRIGLGAGRPEQFQDFAQHLNADVGQPNPAPAADTANASQQPGNVDSTLRRMDPLVSSSLNPASSNLSIQNQILHLEQQINQELNTVITASHQIQVIRLLQNELARLREMNSNRAMTNLSPLSSSDVSSPVLQPHFTSNSRHLTLTDNPLPQGLTLPAGWTLVPLQNAQQPEISPRPPLHISSNFSHPILSAQDSGFQQAVSSPQTGFAVPNPTPHALSSQPEGGLSLRDDCVDGRPQPASHDSSTNAMKSTSPWLQVASDESDNGGDTQTSTCETRPDVNASIQQSPSSLAVKGKSRAATVEDGEE